MSVEQLPLGQSVRLLARSSRAYWLVNLANFGDGIAYFGILTFLSTYLGSDPKLGVLGLSDQAAGLSVSFFTGLVTLFMLNGGRIADRMGVRQAITWALAVSALGRILLAAAPQVGPDPLSHRLTAWIALALMAYGTGVLQPALYAGVNEYTDKRTSSVGWSLLYAIMNLGVVLGEFLSPFLRTDAHYGPIQGLNLGIQGVYWIFAAVSLVLVVANAVLFSSSIEEAERTTPLPPEGRSSRSFFQGFAAAVLGGLAMGAIIHDVGVHPQLWKQIGPVLVAALLAGLAVYLRKLDPRFAFFIFILVPVRMLFAHQWLTVPSYIFRCFPAAVGDRFEWLAIINPILVAVATPLLAAWTLRWKVIDVMILGTALSAATTFVLVLPPHLGLLVTYFFWFSIGEAIWNARFFEYVASLAKPGQTGAYMGVANLPWFLAKFTTGLFSGAMLERYIPKTGPTHPGTLWLIYACVALISPVGLVLGRRWILSAESRSLAADRGSSENVSLQD